jgi:hypothetical protein
LKGRIFLKETAFGTASLGTMGLVGNVFESSTPYPETSSGMRMVSTPSPRLETWLLLPALALLRSRNL